MRSLLISLLVVLLAATIQAGVFKKEKVKLGKKNCLCDFNIKIGDTCSGSVKCDKKCSGSGTVELGGCSFTLAVKKGNGKISKCSCEAATLPVPTEPTIGPGSGETPVPMTGSGSGETPVPMTGSGSGETPVPIPTSPGSGSGGEGMQCSCKCNCPDGSGECDCDCNCPMTSKTVTCAPGFSAVCPMMGDMCPQDMDPICPHNAISRMGGNAAEGMDKGCQCVPDFLLAMVMIQPTGRMEAVDRAMTKATIQVGKKKCKCSYEMNAENCKKSKIVCDKKCSGKESGVEFADGDVMYMVDIAVKKGKVTIAKCDVEAPEPTGTGGGSTGSGSGNGEGGMGGMVSRCACVSKGMGGSGPTVPTLPPTGSGSEPAPPTGSGSEPAPPTGSGSEPAPPTGSGSEPAPPTGSGSGSGLSITENGTTFVETSSYNPSTNTLRVNVPPHNNYGQTDFLLDGNLGQTVMKSNGLCLLSSHGKLDVREMAEKLQQMEKSEEDKFSTEYVVKIRKARVGNQERKKLMGEANEFCKEEGIIRTEDKSVEKEVFEGLAGGKVVTIDSTEYVNSEDECWLKEACTNPGPNACGYGWPNPAGGGISAHQLSATVVCVECCVETLPGCCRKMFPDFCICQDITHKNELMDCILGNTTHEIDYRDPSGTVVHQTMNFNAFNPEGNPRALKMQVHAHDNFQDMTMIMHAAASGYWHHATLKNNMLLKFGARCHILDLPSDVFPIDIGVNFLETESGNFILTQEDQIISTNTLIIDGAIEVGTLHPDIQKLCEASEVVRSRIVPANQTYMEVSTFKLTPGKEIAPMMKTSCCSQQVVSTITGACIQWTNPVTGTAIHVHLVVTDDAETDLTCCNNNANPGCTLLYPDCCACHCTCADITTPSIFRECLSRPLVLRKPITQDSVMNNDLGSLHTSNLLRAMENLKAANGGSLGYVPTYHGDAPGPCGASACCPHGSSLEFLPWHRLYAVQMDTEIRTHSTGVTSSTPAQPFTPATLPYWDWTTNGPGAGSGPMTALPDLVSAPTIIDPMTASVIPNPFFQGFIPGTASNTVRNPLAILFSNPSFLTRVISSLSEPTFSQFSNQLVDPHNDIHWMTGGGGGSMSSETYAAYDPIFYLHHNMIDCVWAVFQYLSPTINPLAGTLSLAQHPFGNPSENPQEITGQNDIVSNTLDYENNLCYTYALTGNPFLERLNIRSNDIVFGGMNLSQISDMVYKVGDTEHLYAGFFLQSFDTSYRITFNICHFYDGQKIRCFPGGALTVFGGRRERVYVNDIVTKVDITDKLDANFVKVDEKNSISVEIDQVETADGKEIPKEELFQPVNVLRYRRFSAEAGGYGARDMFTINFGQGSKNPPKISLLVGTLVKLGNPQKLTIRAPFYEATNKEAFEKCNVQESKLLTSEFEEPSLGLHYYFLGHNECSDKTRLTVNVYWAPRNDVAS